MSSELPPSYLPYVSETGTVFDKTSALDDFGKSAAPPLGDYHAA